METFLYLLRLNQRDPYINISKSFHRSNVVLGEGFRLQTLELVSSPPLIINSFKVESIIGQQTEVYIHFARPFSVRLLLVLHDLGVISSRKLGPALEHLINIGDLRLRKRVRDDASLEKGGTETTSIGEHEDVLVLDLRGLIEQADQASIERTSIDVTDPLRNE